MEPIKKKLLKIQYRNCYIQIPDGDLEGIQLVLDCLEFFKEWFKKVAVNSN